ncbi:ATPase family protein 2 homolog isoform X2 [Ixodes scapularis]|uniref:ATPase family protein 2 homolog isoform X2 n=1 Tax=Ixodes scapularis TaxID=6945 RepID=UPI001C3890E9|nr:ATPase family protein 2 homolog isoform X2 [Ixodes scapularis]
MPPKGKSSKADWQQCTSCGVILATKDVTLHEHCCSKLSGDDDPKHDFIRDCVLHGTLQALPADDTAGLSNSTKSQLLYLNPSCMRMCDIGIKDVVELCEDGERHLLVAWPSRNIGLTGVSIHRQPKPSVPRKVTVAKHSDCIVGASSVTLMPDEKLQQVSVLELQRCILQQNLGVFVRTGSKLQCRVYGHDLRFTVLSAKGEGGLSSGDLLCSSSVDGDDLEEKLQHLTVSEGHSSPSASKTPRPSSAQVHSTPPQRMPLTPSRQGPAAFNTPKAPEGRAGSRISSAVFHRITIGTEVTVMEEGSVGPEVSHRAGYDQIGGLDREIQQLRELVEVPARHPATFSRFGLKPPRGALLFGPPGTGKTLLARAVAAESGASLVVLDGPQVFSKYYGETEAALRNVFKDAVERAPSVLFVDEIDALCPKREAGTSSQEARAVSTLVALLDNLPSMQEKWVLVLGATNRPNNVDPSLRQPGRLDRELEIGVPTASGRLQVLLFGAGKSHEPSVIPSPIIFSASDTGIVSFAPSSSCYIRHGETSIADDTSFDHVTRLHQSSSRTATPLGVLKDWNGLHCASGGHVTLCSSMSNPLVFACLQVLLFGAGKSHEPSVIPSPIIFSASDTGIVSFAPSSSCYIRHGETSIADDTSFDHVTRLHQSSSRTATPLGVLKDWNGLHCASGGHGTLCGSMSNPLVFACLQVLLFGAGKSHEPSVIPLPIIFSASDTGIVSFAPSSSCYIRHGETSIADDTSFDHVTRLHQSSSRTATPLGVLKDWNGLHCASGGHGTLCGSMSNPLVFACLQILRKILGNVRHSLSDEDIVETADAAHGLTGADLAAMCAEAALHSLDRHLKDPTATDAVLSHEVELNMADVAAALKRTKPSAMREVSLEIPKVRWSDIGGMEEVKLKLRQAVEWPWKHREAFERLGATPPHGLLLYGPPGCSKTMVAKALATESGLNFIAIKGPELFSKWVGDSERAVRELFRKARTAAPCIIFFDEIDALAAHRGSTSGSSNVGDRVIAQLLAEMDGIEALQDVVLVAATNRPDMIDQALMRPGRLDSIVYVPLPDLDTRREILRINLSKRPLGDSVSLDDLARKTEGYSGAEVVAVCQEAALIALEEDIEARHITALHLEAALQLVRPRISQETVQYYESYWASTGKGRHSRPGLG